MFQSNASKTVSIIFDKTTNSAIKNAENIKKLLSEQFVVSFSDPLEHPVLKDINIHLEVPIYSYVPWASYNIFIMNPENYIKEAWEPYMKHFDLILTKEDLNLIESINKIPVKKTIKKAQYGDDLNSQQLNNIINKEIGPRQREATDLAYRKKFNLRLLIS